MTRVFIAESLAPDDFYDRRVDGFAANEVLKIQGCASDYRVVLNRKFLRRAIEDASGNGYSVFHLSCHGDENGIQLADSDFIDWLTLARMLRDFANEDRCLVMASCNGGHYGLTKALRKTRSIFGYVLGSLSKVGFVDSALAWSVLYRDIIEDGLNRATLIHAVEKINSVAPGDFVVRRWNNKIYLRYPSASG